MRAMAASSPGRAGRTDTSAWGSMLMLEAYGLRRRRGTGPRSRVWRLIPSRDEDMGAENVALLGTHVLSSRRVRVWVRRAGGVGGYVPVLGPDSADQPQPRRRSPAATAAAAATTTMNGARSISAMTATAAAATRASSTR